MIVRVFGFSICHIQCGLLVIGLVDVCCHMLRWPHQGCDDEEVSDPMTGIRQAKAALRDAEAQAKAIIAAARMELGREILKARAEDIPQKDIAAELELTREQVRRIADAAKHAGASSD